jgi:hypothetical protein
MPPLSQRDRAEQKRRERLELMDQQVREGSLTIRKMTPAEAEEFERAAAERRTRSGRPAKR